MKKFICCMCCFTLMFAMTIGSTPQAIAGKLPPVQTPGHLTVIHYIEITNPVLSTQSTVAAPNYPLIYTGTTFTIQWKTDLTGWAQIKLVSTGTDPAMSPTYWTGVGQVLLEKGSYTWLTPKGYGKNTPGAWRLEIVSVDKGTVGRSCPINLREPSITITSPAKKSTYNAAPNNMIDILWTYEGPPGVTAQLSCTRHETETQLSIPFASNYFDNVPLQNQKYSVKLPVSCVAPGKWVDFRFILGNAGVPPSQTTVFKVIDSNSLPFGVQP